jgi:hypothetical protein
MGFAVASPIFFVYICNMERKELYKAIDTERQFQIDMTAKESRPDMIEDLHVGDTLSAIQYNLDLARKAWYHGSTPHQGAMDYLRKIAGLCVQAGEKNGMPNRDRSFEHLEGRTTGK